MFPPRRRFFASFADLTSPAQSFSCTYPSSFQIHLQCRAPFQLPSAFFIYLSDPGHCSIPFSSSIHPFFAVFHNPSAYFSLEPWMLFCIRKGDPFKRYLLLCLNNLCNSLTERYSMCGGISVFLCWADPYRSKPHVFPILSPGFAKHTIPCADRFRHEHIKSDAVIPMGNHSPFRTILCVSSP